MGFAGGRSGGKSAAQKKKLAEKRRQQDAKRAEDARKKKERVQQEKEIQEAVEAKRRWELANRKATSMWGLFACFNDFGTCCHGFCCFPCLYAKTRAVVNHSSCAAELCKIVVLCPCTMLCFAPAERGLMRRSLHLEPECGMASGDHVAWFFCCCCAMCEEARELQSRRCANTKQYLMRSQECRVSNVFEPKSDSQSPKSAPTAVEKSEFVHSTSEWNQCHGCCCCCAPDALMEFKSEEAQKKETYGHDGTVPEWVIRSMKQETLAHDKNKPSWNFCPGCGDTTAVDKGRLFCQKCGTRF